ncbi:EAL domain-containing protein [Pseudoalteromonas sp. GutCa3]|uniref:EAL domain-containing protein n=1 Tax=Pseudoalteromonas sp. GutCa3 TaxID=888433 RepID=UPI000C31F928|nr:EAL domain-containing protein [Pseudoalteromonas sp. GutCa3]PKG68634.1 hypothetical protein CXF64_20135 [Pseudoalteromonas sp. GutCa3]
MSSNIFRFRKDSTFEESFELSRELTDCFNYYYQPQYSLKTGIITSYECLIRYTHPKMGLQTPDVFLSDLFTYNLWEYLWPIMLRKASTALKALPHNVKLAINVSPKELEDGNYSSFLNTFFIMAKKGYLNPKRFDIEITEDFKIKDFSKVNNSISFLNELGVNVIVDDFGAGFSNLTSLDILNIQGVKIDRGLVNGIENSKIKQTIVKSLVDIGNVKSATILAEGIETFEQEKIVKDLGCTLGQGFFFGKPKSDFVPCFTKATRRDSLSIVTS